LDKRERDDVGDDGGTARLTYDPFDEVPFYPTNSIFSRLLFSLTAPLVETRFSFQNADIFHLANYLVLIHKRKKP